MVVSKGQFIGSTLILTGTAVGAGMLALPMVSAAAGFLYAALLLIGIWALMTYTALLVLEVNLAFESYRNNFSTMAAATLGPVGKAIAWITCLSLLYALTAAYISGDASLLSVGFSHAFNIHVPLWMSAVLFTVVLGSVVFWSTKAVDRLNRGLISLKGVLLVITLVLLMPHIQMNVLMRQAGAAKYLWACAPIFLCSFGSHTVIPSISNYIGPKPKTLKWIIICGATLPLIIYILWLLTTLGIMPLVGTNGFQALAKEQGSVGEFIHRINLLTSNHWIRIGINGFSNIAMTTSFLGVTLGLFDFLADAFKRLNTRRGRLQTALITFVPPLLFAMYFPRGFIVALGYAAIFVAMLEIILPVLMAHQLRRNSVLSSPYRVTSCRHLFIVIVLIGILIIGLQIAVSFHALPTL